TCRCLELFPFRWNRNGVLDSCFDAFSSREPVSTSLENALNRPFALHRNPRAGAGVGPVVPHRAVLGAAIVPERDGVFAPAEAALEQRVFAMLVEIGQHRVALVAGDADEEARKTAIDVKRLL